MSDRIKKVLLATVVAIGTMGMQWAVASEITIVRTDEPPTLDPQLLENNNEQVVNDNIYETLIVRSPTGELGPGLAASMPEPVAIDKWRFKLRPGISFTNGEPFNADAVVASVKRVIDPAFNSAQSSYYETITGAEKVDDLTVDITTKGADPLLTARMYWMKMVPPKASAVKGFEENPIGTGPYKFSNWDRGNSLELVKNDQYWGAAPKIDKVTYRFVNDAGTQFAGLVSGEFDVMSNLSPELISQAPAAKVVQGLEQPIFILSFTAPPTDDPRVRQALNYAVDKQAIVDAIFQGNATVSQGQLLAPSYFGFDADTKAYPYDPEKAKALLKEAGAEGKTVTMVGTSGHWLKDREVAEAVAQMWTDVGLKVDLRIPDHTEYLKIFYDKGIRPNALYVSSSNELMDADRPFSAYYAPNGSGAGTSDPAMTQMVDTARGENDPVKRAALYKAIVAEARDKAYLLWLVIPSDIYGASKRLVWQPRVDGKIMASEMAVTE